LKCTKKICNILGAGSEPAWRAEWDMGKKRNAKENLPKKVIVINDFKILSKNGVCVP
jgi:hypothetical protein